MKIALFFNQICCACALVFCMLFSGCDLGNSGPRGFSEDVNGLIRQLDDPSPTRRSDAVTNLGWLGHKASSAVPALLARLEKEEDKSVRGDIVEALGQIGDGRAVPALKERTAADALAGIAATGMDEKAKADALAAILELGESKEEKTRARVAGCFYREEFAGYKKVEEWLVQAAQDTSPKVRRHVVHSIPYVMSKDGLPLLKDLMKDNDKQVRTDAVVVVTEMGDKAGLAALGEILFDESYPYSTRFEGLLALENVDGDEVIVLLKRWQKESKRDSNAAGRILSKKGIQTP